MERGRKAARQVDFLIDVTYRKAAEVKANSRDFSIRPGCWQRPYLKPFYSLSSLEFIFLSPFSPFFEMLSLLSFPPLLHTRLFISQSCHKSSFLHFPIHLTSVELAIRQSQPRNVSFIGERNSEGLVPIDGGLL